MKSVGRMVILVRAYEEAVAFYTEKLGFEVFVDIDAGPRRYVHIRFPGQPDVGLWLLQAETPDQEARVGNQTAGQPCAVLYTDNIHEDHLRLRGLGVTFTQDPQQESGAICAHLLDLYGNVFVLVELVPD